MITSTDFQNLKIGDIIRMDGGRMELKVLRVYANGSYKCRVKTRFGGRRRRGYDGKLPPKYYYMTYTAQEIEESFVDFKRRNNGLQEARRLLVKS